MINFICYILSYFVLKIITNAMSKCAANNNTMNNIITYDQFKSKCRFNIKKYMYNNKIMHRRN